MITLSQASQTSRLSASKRARKSIRWYEYRCWVKCERLYWIKKAIDCSLLHPSLTVTCEVKQTFWIWRGQTSLLKYSHVFLICWDVRDPRHSHKQSSDRIARVCKVCKCATCILGNCGFGATDFLVLPPQKGSSVKVRIYCPKERPILSHSGRSSIYGGNVRAPARCIPKCVFPKIIQNKIHTSCLCVGHPLKVSMTFWW